MQTSVHTAALHIEMLTRMTQPSQCLYQVHIHTVTSNICSGELGMHHTKYTTLGQAYTRPRGVVLIMDNKI